MKNLKDKITEIFKEKSRKNKAGLLAFKRKEKPGIYEVDGKELTEAEFEILKNDYENIIIFAETENKE